MNKKIKESKKKKEEKNNIGENKKTEKRSINSKQWSPKNIYLQQKRIIINEKEKLMTELASIIYDMQKSYQIKMMETYEKTVT